MRVSATKLSPKSSPLLNMVSDFDVQIYLDIYIILLSMRSRHLIGCLDMKIGRYLDVYRVIWAYDVIIRLNISLATVWLYLKLLMMFKKRNDVPIRK